MASFFKSLFRRGRQEPINISEDYLEMRQRLFEANPDDFGIKDDDWAILMETGLENGTASLMVLADGTTSLYYSNGGGIIGGGEHAECAKTSVEFLNLSLSFKDLLQPTNECPLPKLGRVRFYLLTKTTVLSGEFVENQLGNNLSSLSPLFHKGHEILTFLRLQQKGRLKPRVRLIRRN